MSSPRLTQNPCGTGVPVGVFATHALLAAAFALTVLLPGCQSTPSPETPAAIERYDRGPFSLEIEVAPKEVTVGDPINVTLRMTTPEAYIVQFPQADAFGDLDATAAEPTQTVATEDAKLNWQRKYTLTAFISGEIEIPPLAVAYGRDDADGQFEKEQELATDSIKLTVRSVLTSQDTTAAPRDIAGTLTPAPAPLSPWAWAAIVGGALAAIAALIAAFWWLKRIASRPAPPIAPEVLALRELAELGRGDQFERGAVREFYYRLSEIVRVYVERKFGLAAPEMTTEEFLVRLSRDRAAVPYDTDRLRDFLEACDRVKYAAFEPRREDGEQSISAARAFVDATAASAAAARDSSTTAAREESQRGHAA